MELFSPMTRKSFKGIQTGLGGMKTGGKPINLIDYNSERGITSANNYQQTGFLGGLIKGGLESWHDLGQAIEKPIGSFLFGNEWDKNYPLWEERQRKGSSKPQIPSYTPSQKELDQRDAYRESMAENKRRYQDDLEAKRRRQAARSQEQLDNLLSSNAGVTNEMINRRVQKKIMPVFRPQIRNTKRGIREAEQDRLRVLAEGKQAAGDVRGYYDEAGSMTKGYAKRDRKATRRMAKSFRSDGGMSANEKIALRGAKQSSRANRDFYKRVGAALAGEGAVAAAATRRNYQDVSEQYRDIGNQYKSELADLRSARAQAAQEIKTQIKQNIKKKASSTYEDIYLQGIKAGLSKPQAQKIALRRAKAEGAGVAKQTASYIKKNKGIENALAASVNTGSELSSKERWDRRMDKTGAQFDQVKMMQDQLGMAQEAYNKALENGNDDQAAIWAKDIDALRQKINAIYNIQS